MTGLLSPVTKASIVYEGFDYTVGDAVTGKGAASDGWNGAWSTTTGGTVHSIGGGLSSSGGLLATGGSAQRLGRTNIAQMNRQISTASQTALTADGSTLWFSVLMNPGHNQNGFALNTYGTLILGDTALASTDGSWAANPIGGGGSAIGVGFAGSGGGDDYNNIRIQGVTYKNGVTTQNTAQRITTGNTTVLIVGKVEWAENGSNDTVSLYKISSSSAALPTPFSVMTADLDQSTFDVVGIAAAQTSIFDEIRFDTTLAGVIALDFMSVCCGNGASTNVTVDIDQFAGVGDWLTDGWQNASSASPAGETWSISSQRGLSATFTLNTMRNSSSSMTDTGTRTVAMGDGDGDLMDARFNGSENNRGDGQSGKVNLTVSDIPYDTYDVVLYLSRNANSATVGDASGVVIFNGVTHTFTADTLFDGSYTEIVNVGGTGNYIVFEDITADFFTAEVYGNGANELGLCGFQIRRLDPSVADVVVVSALRALTDHIEGTAPLSDAEIASHKSTIDSYPELLADNAAVIAACFDVVEAYDTEIGPLFALGSPIQKFKRSSTSDDDIGWVVFNVMQYIMDYTYAAENIARYETLLDGYKFGSSAHFPGAVAPPTDPNATYTVSISGSYLKSFGDLLMHWQRPARKPTGAYLAPGSIATITVPASLVGKGYQVRVGAHTWDHVAKPNVLRLDRVTLAYDIDSTEVKVANPLGGGIYIEVPYLADAGTVNVTIKNAVRSPYFSSKSFHTTTLAEWQNTERHHPGPWTDFQSDKFMIQVPTDWIYALDDPEALVEDWDAACDASNELMGHPLIHGKESYYAQVDIQIRGSANFPGYPTCNQGYDPDRDYGGDHTSTVINDPRNSNYVLFHEHGHGYMFPKFAGEEESTVNLLHVAVWNRKYGYSLDEAFRRSRGYNNNEYRTLETTAMCWMMCENFMLEQPMEYQELIYQLKGHAKYVDMARLFGWDMLGDFWYSMNVDHENGNPWKGYDTDDFILRMCETAGADLRPLFQFWGIQQDDPATLAADIAAANLPASADIYNTLVRYKSLIPANNAAFQAFAYAWHEKEPNINSTYFVPMTEQYHASIWDSYNAAYATLIEANVQNIIDLYFPEGPPLEIVEIGDLAVEIPAGSSAMGFSWYGQAGATYGLEVTDNLVTGIWQTVTNVTGADAQISLMDEMDKTNAFYRVSLP